MNKQLIGIFLTAAALSGCASYKNYYRLDENYLSRRQLETRNFETGDEKLLLSSSAQVLQDLGFTLDETETDLGLITAYKDREAGSAGQKAGMIFLAAFFGTTPVYDTKQKIYVTIVSRKSSINDGYNVRAEFARVIFDNMNGTRLEKISDAGIYQDFFGKLSQSVFLTANNI